MGAETTGDHGADSSGRVRARSTAQPTPRACSQAGGEPVAAVGGEDFGDEGLVGLGRGGGKGERDFAEPELEQAIAPAALAVVVALRRRPAQDLDLAIAKPEPAVGRRDLRFERAFVGEEHSRRAALDDRRRDRRAVDVGEALGREDDARVLLAQRLQPFPELAGEAFVVERQPALVDDQQGRPAVKAILDTVEQVGQHGRSRAGPDQPFGLHRLDVGEPEPFRVGVEQPAPWSVETVRLERALQGLALQQHRQAGKGAFVHGR